MQQFSRLQALALIAILLIAAVLRFAGLGQIPAGLYRDEAFNGLDALDVLRGQHTLYFAANNGREPVFIYLVALAVGALGRSPLALRLPAALASLLTIPATYLMARELFNRRVGLLSAAILAVTLWHVHLAHVGLRPVLLPLFMALIVWQAARAARTASARHWIAAGALYGLSFYTYLAIRVTPLIIGALAIYVWLTRPQERRAVLRAALPFAVAALVVVAPLAVYTLGHWDIVMGRSGQVTIFSSAIGGPEPALTLARNVVSALGMFVWRGDFIARHNLPYRPVFDPVMSIFFLAGVLIALIRARRHVACALALIWVGVMLLPTILAEDTPHFLRAVGVLPVIAVFPAVALDQLSNFKFQMSNFKCRGVPWRFDIGYLTLPLLAVSLAFTGYDYFVRYAQDESVRFWFDDAGAQLAAEINRFTGAGWTGGEWIVPDRAPAPDRRVFLDRGLWQGSVNTQFLTLHHSALTLIKPGGELPPPGAGPTLLLLWPYEDWRRDLALLPRQSVLEFRKGALSKGDRDPEPIVTYLVIRAEPYSTVPAPIAQFQNRVQLVGAQIENKRVRLTWHMPQRLDTDYVVFVHARRDGALTAQHDGDPADGLYPTSQWQPGDVVMDVHALTGDWDVARDQLVVGLYRRDTGERVPVVDSTGHAVADSVPIN